MIVSSQCKEIRDIKQKYIVSLMNKNAMIVLLFLLCFIATIIDARLFDSTSSITQVISSNHVNSTTTRCCNDVLWYISPGIPFSCRCVDIVETCESTCKKCTCKHPKQCSCDDYNEYCIQC